MATKRDFQILVQCPTTGARVLGDKLIHFVVPGAKAAWWCCPMCGSWHVMLHMEEKGNSEELFSPEVENLNFNSAQLS